MFARLSWLTLGALTLITALGCASGAPPTEFGAGGGGTGGGGGAGGGGDDLGFDDPAGPCWFPPSTPVECGPGAELIYVVALDEKIYRFSPTTLAFEHVGSVRETCCGPGDSFSMAIDRYANAWVLKRVLSVSGESSSNLYKIDTATGKCADTGLDTSKLPGFDRFGMGFTANHPDEGETLFVASYHGVGIGTIDTSTIAFSPVGTYGVPAGGAELTGTAKGKLYGLMSPDDPEDFESPARFVEIDPKAGALLAQTPIPEVTTGSAWAFAFWGGDFYLFTRPDTKEPIGSSVHRYSPSTGELVKIVDDCGVAIVGAGVSTCAPTVPK